MKIFKNPQSLSMVDFELLEKIDQAKYLRIEITTSFDESPCLSPKNVLRISSTSLLDNKELIENIKKEAIKFAIRSCRYNIDDINEDIQINVDKIKEQENFLQEFEESLNKFK